MKYSFLALVLAVSVCASGRAQTGEKPLGPQGTDAFRSILHHFKLQPVRKPRQLRNLQAAETLIVVFGDSRFLDRQGPEEFRKDGGALLIATDRNSGSWLKRWGWDIPADAAVEDQRDSYREQVKCPKLVPTRDTHPVFFGIRQDIATNRPNYLKAVKNPGRAFSLETLAIFPGTALVPGQVPRDRSLPFMVGSADPDRILVLAGHGVFMNI